MHRVVTNAERERNTLAVFIMPDVDVEIGPVDKLINEERPRAYKNVKSFVGFFFQSYQQGKRPIEAAKICQELHSLTTKSSLSCFSVQPPLTVCWFLLPLFVFLVVVACVVHEPNTKVCKCIKLKIIQDNLNKLLVNANA
ncbi:hypothetical protein P3L10_028311 [Capsicum annuum]